jgi:hypothetical protein
VAIRCSAVAIEAWQVRDFSSCVIFCLGMDLLLDLKGSLRAPIADAAGCQPTKDIIADIAYSPKLCSVV